MKTPKFSLFIPFGLLLLCLGCEPITQKPAIPTVLSTPQSGRTNEAATSVMATPQVVESTADLSYKPTQPISNGFVMASREILVLEGGLTDEARSTLQAGKTGYFVLGFTDPRDRSIHETLQNAGITPLDSFYWVLAKVPPSALETLEIWSRDGWLTFVGTVPPKGKIEPRLTEAILASPGGTSEISVILCEDPDEATRKQIQKLFVALRWPEPQVMQKALPAIGGSIRNKNVEALTNIPVVLEVLKSGGPTIQ
jgi:hypothetical protein